MSDRLGFACRICGGLGPFKTHCAREMMFGTREQFDYLECSTCGTVQIAQVPDLANYYPEAYYSFEEPARGLKAKLSILATRAYYDLRGLPFAETIFSFGGIDSRLVDRGLGLKSVLNLEPSRDTRILDVGCGSAALLKMLARLGFTSLTGIDRYLRAAAGDSDIDLRAEDISDIEGEFDLVMFHHSLEHMTDPTAALAHASRLLSPGGRCLVRIPLLANAWEKYGVNWVGLDPPRHLAIMTEETARNVAAGAGFEVVNVMYDSTSFQFSASEKYSLNIPLTDGSDVFSRRRIREWEAEAKRLNRLGRGDQAAFILKKPDV